MLLHDWGILLGLYPFSEFACRCTCMFPENLTEIALVFITACTGNIQDPEVGVFQKILRMSDPFLCDVIKEVLAGFLLENIAEVRRIAVNFPGQVIQIDAGRQVLQNILSDPGNVMSLLMAACTGGGIFIQESYEILQNIAHKIQI